MRRWPTPAALAADRPPRRSGRGAGSGTRGGLCACTRARPRSSSTTTARYPPTSPTCSRCRASGRTPRTLSRRSRSAQRHPGGRHQRPPVRRARRRRQSRRRRRTTTRRPARRRGAAADRASSRRASLRRVHGDRCRSCARPARRACGQLPDAGTLRLASGRLARGPTARPGAPQAYAGTDRQIRGALLAVLRDADGPVHRVPAWICAGPNPSAGTSALASLIADGLAVQVDTPGQYALGGEG